MSVTTMPTTEPKTGPAEPPPPTTPTPIAVAIPGPLTYIFELSRDGVYAGGGRIDAPSPTAAARTVALTMAGGAQVRIVGHVPPRVSDQRAA